MTSLTISDRLIPQKQYATPTVGQTVTVNSNGWVRLFINPAGTLATLTIAFPGSPTDQDTIEIGTSQVVTALTMNGGTITGALTVLAVGTSAKFVYFSDTTTWIRMGG